MSRQVGALGRRHVGGIGRAVHAAPMIGSHMARRPATSPTAGGLKPDSAVGASAEAIPGSKVKGVVVPTGSL